MERRAVARWVKEYERAWRSPGTARLAKLFTPDVSYVRSPWETPLQGMDEVSAFWEAERDGPDEQFLFSGDVVAVDGNTAVVRVSVEYLSDGAQWRDLWVLHFAPDGRCERFEEWPFEG